MSALPPLTLRAFARGLLTTSVSVGVAAAGGDVLSQAYERHDTDVLGPGWDHARTLRMAVAGTCVGAPISFSWNQALERVLPGRQLRAVFAKMALTMLLFSPANIAISFTTITLLAGKTLDDARHKIEQDLPVTMAVGAGYWPFVGFIQFRFVPLDYRPLVGSVAGLIYQTFFSSMANRPTVPASSPEQPVPAH